jgi:glycosyltransferase involved in cell wall biosynthesis
VLHFGNIANNAYLNAKFLRAIGVDAQVMSSDYDHIMATPEWEEVEITRPYGDEQSPEFSLMDLKGYRRPEWFFRGRINECAQQIEWQGMRSLLTPAPIEAAREVGSARQQELQAELIAEHLEYVAGKIRTQIDDLEHLVTDIPRNSEAQLEEIAARVRAEMASLAANLANQIVATADQLKAISAQVDAVATQIEWLRARLLRSWASALREAAIEVARRLPGMRRVYRAVRYGEPLLGSRQPSVPAHPSSEKQISWCTEVMPLSACTGGEHASGAESLPGAQPAQDAGPVSGAAPPDEEEPEIARAINDFKTLFPDRPDLLTRADLVPFVAAVVYYRKAFEHFDVVQCYGTHPLWGYLAGNRPYVGFEHGTLRDLTRANNTVSRLAALGYRKADHTFITNGDCLAYAKALGIADYSAMIHPVDIELHRRGLREPRAATKSRFQADVLLFCPLRHDWRIKGTDVHLRALPLIRESVPGRVVLLLVDWGLETAAGRALLAELNCQDLVVWVPPLSRIPMARLMQAADVVLDQIALPHFGATAPQALAAETPVISSYRPESTEWLVGEPAPILPAFSPEEVRKAVLTALDPEWRDVFQKRARHWVDTYHHPDRLVKEHLRVYRRILGRSHGFGHRAVAPAV